MLFHPITIISLLIWFIIPILHWRRKFFFYFLVLGLTDVTSIILTYYFGKIVFYPYVLTSFLLIVSLQDRSFVYRFKYYIVAISVCIIYFGGEHSPPFSEVVLLSLHIIILIRILYLFVIDVGNNLRLNLFYVFLLFYEITVISKFLNILFNLVDGAMYFNITTAFEIFIGLFFLFFRYDNSRIVFQLK